MEHVYSKINLVEIILGALVDIQSQVLETRTKVDFFGTLGTLRHS